MPEQDQNLANRGFWYETTPDGKRLLCFRIRVHGRKFIQRLELPPGAKELKPVPQTVV